MLLKSDDMAVINEIYFEVSSFAYENLFACKEFIHTRLSRQHFIHVTETDPYGYVLWYVVDGQGMVYANGNLHGLKTHNLLFIDLSQPFYVTSHNWEIAYMYITGKSLKELIAAYITNEEIIYIKDNDHLLKQFYYLNHNLRLKKDELFLSGSVQILLSEIKNDTGIPKKSNDKTLLINKAMTFIEQNYMNSISLDKIARHIGFSQYYFVRIFKEETGFSPYDYLLQVRCNHAKYLLVTTEEPLELIALDVGFKNELNFYQTFKNRTGVSPREFRKTGRLNI